MNRSINKNRNQLVDIDVDFFPFGDEEELKRKKEFHELYTRFKDYIRKDYQKLYMMQNGVALTHAAEIKADLMMRLLWREYDKFTLKEALQLFIHINEQLEKQKASRYITKQEYKRALRYRNDIAEMLEVDLAKGATT
jgi:hypothetical protein